MSTSKCSLGFLQSLYVALELSEHLLIIKNTVNEDYKHRKRKVTAEIYAVNYAFCFCHWNCFS